MKTNIILFVVNVVLLVSFATCTRLADEKRNGDYVYYHNLPPLGQNINPYEIPLNEWYDNNLQGVFWPPRNIPDINVPFGNIPVFNIPIPNVPTVNVPFGNVPPLYFPYPSVPGVPFGNTPPVGNFPNGLFPPPTGSRPNLPPKKPQGKPTTELDDEAYGSREPLQPNSDGVIDPEVGLKESLVKLGPTMFGGTFDVDNMRFDGFSSWMKLLSSSIKPWWKGPNVCIEREEKITSDDEEDSYDRVSGKPDMFFKGSVNIQTCVEYGNKYECTIKEQKMGTTKVMTVTYHCCHGSQLENRKQCVESELQPLVETIRSLNGTEFLTIAHGLTEMLNTENVTVFLPSNEAFDKFSDRMLLTNQIELYIDPSRRRRSVSGFSPNELATNHIVKGFQEISPDETFNSMYKNSTLQIKYKRDGRMVNCARIGKSVHATNGIVHTIDGVLMPVTRNISEILRDRAEFSMLNDLLKRTGLINDLAEDEIWTFFAPTNEAFSKLDQKIYRKIMNGDGCVKNILRYHMLSQPLCSIEVYERMRVKNSMGDIIKLSLPNKASEEANVLGIQDPAFLVDNVRVTKPDILATNGIIHAIDEVIIPESATPITFVMQQKNLTKFYSLIRKAGMVDEIQTYSNVTFFAPTDKAFEQFIEYKGETSPLKTFLEYDEEANGPMSKANRDALRKFVSHHISQGAIQSCSLQDNGFLNTVNDDNKLRVNLYSTFPVSNTYNRATVDCARLLHFDYQQCDNILHQIDQPLTMYRGNILDQINYMPELSMLNKILPDTETEKLLKDSEDITFLAPINGAFEAINKADYEELLTNKKMVDTILKQHIVKGVSCCAGLNYIPWPFTSFLKAFNDVQLEIRNEQIGSAPIKSCDHVASNGVMHLTNKVMIPRKSILGNRKSNFDILLFGLNN